MAARRTNSAMMETLRREALNLAGRAIEQDNSGNFEVAKRHYQEVVRLLGLIIERMGSQPSERNIIINKREEYVRRIEQLDSSILFSKAQAILKKAKSEEEQFKFVQALNSYLEAVEPLLQAQKHANDSLKAELRIQIKQTLDKAEPLKKLRFPPRPRNGLTPSSKLSPLTDTERKILLDTSRINEKIFLPWYDDDDLNEPFLFDKLFTDLDGPLQLSLQQKELFGSWKRPYQVMKNPVMIAEISSSNIVQDIVTDCSFVASLCVSAAYERRHNKQLITKCIYPQDEHGKPMYNPFVDDLLPVSRDGTLMCTFSTNKDELWPSIVEKAYLKLMGGYDFPGSNSGIDLYALTEWLPEHIFITEAFDKESTWKRLFRGQKDGNVLVIISTGEMDEERANTVGLVPTHAYAVL
ncbi:120_t:CDS:10, partial [Paraglomus occultum]